MVVGGLPVKMTTIIGKPVEIPKECYVNVDKNEAAENVARLCAESIQSLIVKHQTLPGSIIQALRDRFS